MKHYHPHRGHHITHECQHEAPHTSDVCPEPCDEYQGSYRWAGRTFDSLTIAKSEVDRQWTLGERVTRSAGYLTTELLTVAGLSLIPVSIILVWVAKMAAMVTAV